MASSRRSNALLVAALVVAPVALHATGADAAAPKVVQVAITSGSVCAAYSTHSVSCADWLSMVPSPVSGVTAPSSLAAGDSGFMCWVNTDHTVSCRGDNSFGQLGVNNVAVSATPITVPGITDAVQVAAGNAAACAVHSTGAVTCWGYGAYTGNGLPAPTAQLPIGVPGITTATQISGSRSHFCARLANASVTCWGDNNHGQLGFSGWNDYLPHDVSGLVGVKRVTVADGWSCAVVSGAKAKCWGTNQSGQLATVVNDPSNTPTPTLMPIVGVKELELSAAGGCALAKASAVWCWGSGTSFSPPAPAKVTGIPAIKHLATDDAFNGACAITKKAAVWCWGSPSNNIFTHTPVAIAF